MALLAPTLACSPAWRSSGSGEHVALPAPILACPPTWRSSGSGEHVTQEHVLLLPCELPARALRFCLATCAASLASGSRRVTHCCCAVAEADQALGASCVSEFWQLLSSCCAHGAGTPLSGALPRAPASSVCQLRSAHNSQAVLPADESLEAASCNQMLPQVLYLQCLQQKLLSS